MGCLVTLQKGKTRLRLGLVKKQKSLRSQDPGTLGDFGGLDKFLLRVLTRFRSGPVLVQSHLELRWPCLMLSSGELFVFNRRVPGQLSDTRRCFSLSQDSFGPRIDEGSQEDINP